MSHCRRHPDALAPTNPHPLYGRVVFQAACNGTVYADYKTQAANYDSTQLFVRILAWAIVALCVWRLSLRAWRQVVRS